MRLRRRAFLAAAAAAPLAACTRDEAPRYDGGWVGATHERGHRLRDAKSGALPAPSVERRAGVLVVGAGVAGLACARSLARAGHDDVQAFELEDTAGGNARAHRIGGVGCPLGAHYLPLPGPHATEVAALLDELGLRRIEHGRAVYDERHLCHSPQERLFIAGRWHDGLLPPADALPARERAATLAQYERFAAAVRALRRGDAFTLPTRRSRWSAELSALDAITFAQWLAARQLDAPALRWYLDYCCRDDYGAGTAQVSAWAGLHYFASRHGFEAPGAGDHDDAGVLTWPEGNAWITSRLAAPLGERLRTGSVVLRVSEGRHDVHLDAWNMREQRVERWRAPRVVLATPLFVSARLLDAPDAALQAALAGMRYAPWLVANLHVDAALDDRPGAPPSWDNVVYGSASLGHVDAMHQSTRPYAGATVLTSYWALGDDPGARRRLLDEPWSAWAARVLAEVATPHPDAIAKVRRIDLMRYGHAMSIPLPGVRSNAALQALHEPRGRVLYAHADLSGYSVFEEAIHHGERAARRVMARSH